MICVYPADCTDFSNNGNGILNPKSCVVSETLNGEWELELVHPLDEEGKWTRLVEGCILRAPVPAAMTPSIDFNYRETTTTTTSVVFYKVQTTSGKLNLRNGPGMNYKVLTRYAKGVEVVVLNSSNSSWYEVSCPDGKHGWMSTDFLVYSRTETTTHTAYGEKIREVVESHQLRDQPFRIYRVVPELKQVTVYARHVFYDLMDNMVRKIEPAASAAGASVVRNVSEGCLSQHGFTFYSNLQTTAAGVSLINKNPVEALLGEGGVAEMYGGELARDWWDVFVVDRVGSDSGVQIREGKNLTGISYDLNLTDVVTRIMPTGTDKDGNILYLPEVYVDSENIDAYQHPKWIHLDVAEAKEVTTGDSTKTKAQCYSEMRAAAQARFAAGCDLPTVSLSVDFVSVKDSEEYRDYTFLQDIFLGDTVRVIAPRIGVAVSLRMTRYKYDCLLKRYTSMTLGSVMEALEGNTISARQLPSGIINGSKLAINSVGQGALQGNSVGNVQIQAAAIDTAHIRDASISTAKIADASITAAKIADAQIDSAKIADASITRAKIADAAIGTAQIEDGSIVTAHIGAGEIQTANIAEAAVTTAKITDGAITNAKIGNAAVDTANITDAAITNAKIGGAAVGTANIQDAAIVSAKILDGSVTKAKIADLAVDAAQINNLAVTTAKIANGAITNAKIGNAAVNTAQIALGAITQALIAQGAVGTAQIEDASITDAKIVSLNADVITSGTLATERLIIRGDDGLIYEINAKAGGLTSQQLSDAKYRNALSGTVLVARSVTAEQIAAATITANEILAGSITGDRIAANTIEGANIKAGTITTAKVSSDFGKTLDLSSNTGLNLRVEQINSDIDEVRSAAVAEVQVQYALSASSIIAPATGWQTDAPAWEDGKFMWQRTVTTYADGETETSSATCLTGATGAAGEAATTLRIESSRGTVFKRDDVSTVLSAVIYHGSERITNISALRVKFGQTAYLQWKWRRRDDSGYGTISASDSRLTNNGFSLTVTTADVDANVTFMCELITD